MNSIFLILTGTFQKNSFVAILASLGIILAAAYMLWLYGRVFFGKKINLPTSESKDLNKVEIYILATLGVLIIFFGFI